MLNADNILTPHSPEVFAELNAKRRARFEENFPGLLQKVREWIKSGDFKKRYANINFSHCGSSWFAPASMEFEMREMSGKHASEFTVKQSNIIAREAVILWNEGKYDRR